MIKQTRVTPSTVKSGKNEGKPKPAIVFQHQVCGQTESLVSNEEITYWADGIEGTTLVDAKFVSENKKSPFRQECPDFVQKFVEDSITEEFNRVKQILETTYFTSFKVIINDELAIDFFQKVGSEVGLKIEFQVA